MGSSGRARLIALLLSAAAFNGYGCAPRLDGKKDAQPNVLLIVVDTLRKDHLGVYGYGRDTSPNIDRLAADGVRYESAFSQAPWTTPSLGSLLTSQYPTVLGIDDAQSILDDDWILLPEVLRDHEYSTGAVVSHTYCSSRWNFSQGFDSFDESNIIDYNAATSPGVTQQALEFLDHQESGPFFLFLHYFDPHETYLEQPGFAFSRAADYSGPVQAPLTYRTLRDLSRKLEPGDVAEIERHYDTEIAFTDKYVGQVLDEFRARGLYDETLIIFTADHGEEFKEHGRLGHAYTLFQEQINVPLIIKYPGQGAAVVSEPVALIDIYPTVLAATGISVDHALEGISLMPSSVTSARRQRTVFSETSRKHKVKLRAAVTADQKTILNLKNGESTFYDLAADPGEMAPLSNVESAGFGPLASSLAAWVERIETLKSEGSEIVLTPEEIQRLKSLGYISE